MYGWMDGWLMMMMMVVLKNKYTFYNCSVYMLLT